MLLSAQDPVQATSPMSQVPPPLGPDDRPRVPPPAASSATGEPTQIVIDTGQYEPIPSRRRNRKRKSSWLPALVLGGMGLVSIGVVIGVSVLLLNTANSTTANSTTANSTTSNTNPRGPSIAGGASEAETPAELVDSSDASSDADRMTEQDWPIASAALNRSLDNVHDVKWNWRPLYVAVLTTAESGGLSYETVTSRAEAEAALPRFNARWTKVNFEQFGLKPPPLVVNELVRIGTEFTITFKGETKGKEGAGDAVIRVHNAGVSVVGTPIEVNGKPTAKQTIEVRRSGPRVASFKKQNFSAPGLTIRTAGSQVSDVPVNGP